MTKEEKREQGIEEFQEFLKAAIRRNVIIPKTINNEQDLEYLIKTIVNTAVYNLNHKSGVKISFDGEWLNNQEDDFQKVK